MSDKVTRIEVTGCHVCPFKGSGGGQYDGDYPFTVWCQHPAAPAYPGQQLDDVDTLACVAMTPPDWCPLRTADVLVTLKSGGGAA